MEDHPKLIIWYRNYLMLMKQYKKIEDEWAAALKAKPPKGVTVDVEIIYHGNDMRPKEFIVNYSIDGKADFRVIKN